MPALPVPEIGSVATFSVAKAWRRRSIVSLMTSAKAGSMWPIVGCASAASTRGGTGLGPEPSSSRCGMSVAGTAGSVSVVTYGASTSGKLSARCSRRTSRIQRFSSVVAIR